VKPRQLLIALTPALFFGLAPTATLQAAGNPIVLNFKVSPSTCQPATKPPSYYCLGYMHDVDANGNPTTESQTQDEWGIYTTVNSDGTFNTGFLSGYFDLDNPDAGTAAQMLYLKTTSIQGAFLGGAFTGTASGYLTDNVGGTFANGRTFAASFSNLLLGTVKCGGYKGTVRYCTAIVSGSITISTTTN
jgi:hypothetical protein